MSGLLYLEIMGTYQECNGHDGGSQQQRTSPSDTINNQGLNYGTSNLQRTLNPARQQTQVFSKSQGQEICGKVVFHCCRSAHLRHKLQQCDTPEAGEQFTVGKEDAPRVVRDGIVQLNVIFYFIQFRFDCLGIVFAASQVLQGFLGLDWTAFFEEPARTFPKGISLIHSLLWRAGTQLDGKCLKGNFVLRDSPLWAKWQSNAEDDGRNELHEYRKSP